MSIDPHEWIAIDEAARLLTNHRGSEIGKVSAENYLRMICQFGRVPGGPLLHNMPPAKSGDPWLVRERDIEAIRPFFADLIKADRKRTADERPEIQRLPHERAEALRLTNEDIGLRPRGRQRGFRAYPSEEALVVEGVNGIRYGKFKNPNEAADQLAPRAIQGANPFTPKKRLYRQICAECEKLGISWR
jgi:hypothetical protein